MSQSRHLSCSLQEVGGALGFCSETCWLSKAFDFLLLFKQAPLLCFAHTCTHIHTHAHTHTHASRPFSYSFLCFPPLSPLSFGGPSLLTLGLGPMDVLSAAVPAGGYPQRWGVCVHPALCVCVCAYCHACTHVCTCTSAHAHSACCMWPCRAGVCSVEPLAHGRTRAGHRWALQCPELPI